jgi:hypothetical protein
VRRRGLAPRFIGGLLIVAGLCALAALMWWPVVRELFGVEDYAPEECPLDALDVVCLRNGSALAGHLDAVKDGALFLRGARLASAIARMEKPDSQQDIAIISMSNAAEIILRGRYLATMPVAPRIYLADGSILVAAPLGLKGGYLVPKIRIPGAGPLGIEKIAFRLDGPIRPANGQEIEVPRRCVNGISFSEWRSPFGAEGGNRDVIRLRDGAAIAGAIRGISPGQLAIVKSADRSLQSVDCAGIRTVAFSGGILSRYESGEAPSCVVTVADGSRLKGKIVSMDGSTMAFISPLLGQLLIQRSAIERMEFSSWAVRDEFPLVLAGKDGQTILAVASYEGIKRVIPTGSLELNISAAVSATPRDTVLVPDERGNAVYELDLDGKIVWQFRSVEKPTAAVRLPTGNTLICDYGNDRVIEVSPGGDVVWSVKAGGAMDCCRMARGRTLIAENYSSRLVEVNPAGNQVWQAAGLTDVMDALRQDDGNTLVLCGSEELALRKIAADGSVLWEVKGFSRPARILAGCKDRVLVFEPAQRRLTILDNYGTRSRVIELRLPPRQ